MRAEELWSGLAALGWVVTLVGCHSPGSELESVRYGPTTADERFVSDTYTVANINITYQDEHGEEYTETSEVSSAQAPILILLWNIETIYLYDGTFWCQAW